MLFNRIQSTSSLLCQTQFNFATKNLKTIKLRMKAVESIKKITKVQFLSIFRPWRWSLHPRWDRMLTDSKKPNFSVLDQSKKLSTTKPSSKRRSNPSLLKSGSSSQLPQTRVSAAVLTPVSSDKSRPWSRLIEAHTKSSSSETRVQWLSQETCQTSSNSVSPTFKLQWTSQPVQNDIIQPLQSHIKSLNTPRIATE